MTTQRAHVHDRAANTFLAVGKYVRSERPRLGGTSRVPVSLVLR